MRNVNLAGYSWQEPNDGKKMAEHEIFCWYLFIVREYGISPKKQE